MKVNTKNIRKNVMHVLSGTILTEDFFVKNTRFIFVVFIILVLYISNRYSCIEKRATIVSLQGKLDDAKYEASSVSTQLVRMGRQDQVRVLVEKYNLGIEMPKEPAYSLSK